MEHGEQQKINRSDAQCLQKIKLSKHGWIHADSILIKLFGEISFARLISKCKNTKKTSNIGGKRLFEICVDLLSVLIDFDTKGKTFSHESGRQVGKLISSALNMLTAR